MNIQNKLYTSGGRGSCGARFIFKINRLLSVPGYTHMHEITQPGLYGMICILGYQ